MPARTLLLGAPPDAFDFSLGGIDGVLEGEGVKGVEKGWAADVDIAGGGDSGWARIVDVESVRIDGEARARWEKRRVQRWQIIVSCRVLKKIQCLDRGVLKILGVYALARYLAAWHGVYLLLSFLHSHVSILPSICTL